MSGYDKYHTAQELKAKGWTEDTEAGDYMLRPPRELIEKLASMVFHVYDARDLQEFAEKPEADDKA